jgi:hypothetical protein
MTSALSIVLLAVMAGPQSKPSQPQKKTPPAPPKSTAPAAHVHLYTGKYDAARGIAKERNVPILIHIVLEGEAQNDEYRDKILPDRDLVAACANVIVIVANNGKHEKKTIEETVDGKPVKREVCAAYGVDSCTVHQRFWDDVYREFKEENGELLCPQLVLLAPDGKIARRINTRSVPAATEVLAAIKDAQAKAGPGLTDAELAQVKQLMQEGRVLTAAKSWPDALRAWQKLLAITPKGMWADEAQKSVPVVQAGLDSELARISALLVPGKAADGYRELLEFTKQCAGLPIEKEAKSRLAKAELTKEIKDEIAAYKLDQEADALLTEARGCFDAKQDKKGEHTVRRLLGKRYVSTPAAAKARELWPDWAKEEDAKVKK